MKLYYSKGACSLAVRIIIHELGANAEFEAVNLQSKQTETGQDYWQINPKGAVPALVTEDKEILTENAAIQQYLADTHKAQHLLPPVGDFKRYRVLEWLNFVSTELHKGCSPLFNAKIAKEIKETIFVPQLKSKLKFIEQRLSGSPYVILEHFTIVDAYLFVILSWLPHLGLPLEEWPHISHYFNELKKRESVRKALKEEGIM